MFLVSDDKHKRSFDTFMDACYTVNRNIGRNHFIDHYVIMQLLKNFFLILDRYKLNIPKYEFYTSIID